MPVWNFADVWEEVAAAVPDRPAQIQGERVLSWRDFDRRSNALARHLLDAGLQHQSKVAAYLTNCPEYLETYYAAFKAGLAPVNTNYRYGPEELFYLFDNADAEAIVFHAGFAEPLEAIRPRLTGVKAWIAVAEPGCAILLITVPPTAPYLGAVFSFTRMFTTETQRAQRRFNSFPLCSLCLCG